jgi:hypothetical protein
MHDPIRLIVLTIMHAHERLMYPANEAEAALGLLGVSDSSTMQRWTVFKY